MKRILFLLGISCSINNIVAQNIGIGTSTPDASALLEIKSANKGVLIPRVTTAQMNAIANPAKGLMVLDTISNQLMINMGTDILPNWQDVVTGSGWGLNGNTGTSILNYLGTADNNPLFLKVNNLKAGTINHFTQNTFYGYLSGNSISSGKENTFLGDIAGTNNTTGSANTATGSYALKSNTTGNGNTAIGISALASNTIGINNTANGIGSLFFNSSGSYNTANGLTALSFNTTGNSNTADGTDALRNNSTGNFNTAIGYSSMGVNQTGSWNTCLGENTNVSASNLNGATAIGTGAITNADNKIVIGAALPGTMVIGGYANWSNLSDGRFKTNVQDDVPGLNFITKLKPVSYNIDTRKLDIFLTQNMPDSIGHHYIKQDDVYSKSMQIRHTGFIAQDVEKIAAGIGWKFDAVNAPKNPGDNYSIAYSQFVMPLVKAVQEQQQQIETLQKENVELKDRLERLEKIILH